MGSKTRLHLTYSLHNTNTFGLVDRPDDFNTISDSDSRTISRSIFMLQINLVILSVRMRNLYRVFRSIIMTAVITVVGLIILLYIGLSLPSVQNVIRLRTEKELSQFLGSKVEIGEVQVIPFNQAVIKDLVVYDRQSRKALQVSRVGAGIALWRLLWNEDLVFTHAEIVGLRAQIIQDRAGEPLNIQFIIDAFKPKEPGKPPTKFDFRIRHVVIRESAATFNRLWKALGPAGKIDFNHLAIHDLAADVSLPRMKNDDFTIDLRRLRFKESSGFALDKLQCQVHLTPSLLEVKGLVLNLPHTSIQPGDIKVESTAGKWQFLSSIESGHHRFTLEDAEICPADMAAFLPELKKFNHVYAVNLDVAGNFNDVQIAQFTLNNPSRSLSLNLKGDASNLGNPDKLKINLSKLRLLLNGAETANLVEALTKTSPQVAQILKRLDRIDLSAKAQCSLTSVKSDFKLISALGNIDGNVALNYKNARNLSLQATVNTPGFNVGQLLAQADLGSVAIDAECDISLSNGYLGGTLSADVPFIDYKGKRWQNIVADVTRNHALTDLAVTIDDADARLQIDGTGSYATGIGALNLTAAVEHLNLGAISFHTPLGNSQLRGNLDVDVKGNNIRDLDGEVSLTDFHILYPGKKAFDLDFLELRSFIEADGIRTALIRSPYINGTLQGHFSFARMPFVVTNILAPACPSFIAQKPIAPDNEFADLRLYISNTEDLQEYFNLPVKVLEDVSITGNYNESKGSLKATVDVPYLLQGRDKLIRDTRLSLNADRETAKYNLSATTTMPAKSNEVTLRLGVNAFNDSVSSELGWKVHRDKSFGGDIRLVSLLKRNPINNNPDIDVRVLPSTFDINDTTWHISPASIHYSDRYLTVNGVRVSSDDQYATIQGRASALPTDSLNISLRDIDLDYVFASLGINYVTFGGLASGKITGKQLFSSSPIAYTNSLFVKGLTYNGGLLGDALLSSKYDAANAMVSIGANITENNKFVADVEGGIWVKRDSLSFGINADKVNIRFMQPFMMAFANKVEGRASGYALLYGTFHDIDLRGKLFADTIALGLDFTNTTYYGSDSVFIHPGHIQIPSFRLYDKEGHSANVTGWVKHRYFHEPSFNFNITNARSLLCYDTNSQLNPIWYGRIYGNGGASINGRPGIVNMLVDMQTAPGSVFTFVLSDTQEAGEYNFLTFTDKRKEALAATEADTIPAIRRKYMKLDGTNTDSPSAYILDLRASVTPQAEMILVMDPVAGDKIKAYGTGNLQMCYSSLDDKLTMYGRYTLDRGTYNFSLQDLILKTFTIRPGSSISFNGDPYQAQLNIDALYRVNTNLTDLDPSFATDRDLNRTNIPVDAVLKAQGEMTQPDISFDIELPSVNEDVERKVKSIISTEDMMSRQIIYLLALNRFYTPEYMGAQNSGNEFASIGFSTLSSHLTNILGQLTPNWSFAPNVRTDQGDFSDLAVDLALSSRLFNNRLLLNGNFGYRDKTSSSTTFIGDFDLEYLLNRSGSLRLKAYNHFNDQNYYLKSALTTQGLGVIYKHDFDRWFSFLRPKRRKIKMLHTVPASSTEKPDTLLKFK